MDLEEYYSARAREYDEIYEKPERQHDLKCLRKLVVGELHGLELLEVACGTGYWTELLAPVARSLMAVDINKSVIEIARNRALSAGTVQFILGDAYCLPLRERKFAGGLAVFWWSHVPKNRIPEFLRGFFGRLRPPGAFVFIDNNYVPGSSTPISQTDADGNTYQNRKLRNGNATEVLKNFPTTGELKEQLQPFAAELRIEQLEYYWCAIGKTAAMSHEEEAQDEIESGRQRSARGHGDHPGKRDIPQDAKVQVLDPAGNADAQHGAHQSMRRGDGKSQAARNDDGNRGAEIRCERP